ncbi:MAG: nucleoside 2-deoxyribosyltransferase [Clostridiales bacterium]|nr:nucleoside 2-deoxyribosyltransferase [Clostridiales bacterium]
MKKCFVVCPIGNEGSDIRKHSDQLFKHIIQPICNDLDFEATRIDHENKPHSITDGIIHHLTNDELVIADLTKHNPNAFFEMGYRAALQKPSIYLATKGTVLPFDVSSINTLFFDLQDLDSVDLLKERLRKTISSISFDENDISSDTPASIDTSSYSELLQEIYKIQDSITQLSQDIKAKDNDTLSVLVDKIAGAQPKSTEAILMETLLPKLLEDPEQLIKFSQIASKLPTIK